MQEFSVSRESENAIIIIYKYGQAQDQDWQNQKHEDQTPHFLQTKERTSQEGHGTQRDVWRTCVALHLQREHEEVSGVYDTLVRWPRSDPRQYAELRCLCVFAEGRVRQWRSFSNDYSTWALYNSKYIEFDVFNIFHLIQTNSHTLDTIR